MPEKKGVMDIEILSRSALEGEAGDEKIKRVVVLGAGTMGRGISQLIASKGLDVILIERHDDTAKLAVERLEQTPVS